MDVHKKLVEEIEKKLPSHIKPVMYLMDLLSLGREAAYRRWNGQSDFTVKELVLLCSDLELSLDSVIGQMSNTRIFFDMPVDLSHSTEKLVTNMLKRSIFVLHQLLSSPDESKSVAALNHLPFQLLPSVSLFKLQYYKHLHSYNEIAYNRRFSEIVIPQNVVALYNENMALFNQLNNIVCIVDRYTFPKVFDEIAYLCRLQIFNDEEKAALKQEMIHLLSFLKKLMFTGLNFNNKNYQLYYSPIAINSSCLYHEYGKQNMAQFWIYPEPISIHNNRLMINMQKNIIESIIKYSVLITKSNNMQQSEILMDLEKRINEIFI